MAKDAMVTRHVSYDEFKDDFPTPPWATRAMLMYGVPSSVRVRGRTVREPACGRGHMVRVLRDEFRCRVSPSDVVAYEPHPGLFRLHDYLTDAHAPVDFVFTNPPFKKAQAFVEKALQEARVGVAVILRTLWIDTGDRRFEFLNRCPANWVSVYAGRMDAARGRILRTNSSFMSHSVFWWDQAARLGPGQRSALGLIPPSAQRELELDSDYHDDYLTR